MKCAFSAIETRLAHHGDLNSIVAIHLDAFPRFFLSSLGPRFLHFLYKHFIEHPSGIAIVAVDKSGQILGFVTGCTDPKGFYRKLLVCRWPSLGFIAIKHGLANPGTMIRLFRGIWYRGAPPKAFRGTLLSSIAVTRSMMNRGTGSLLIKAWENEARRRGAAHCYLTTDAVGNDEVNDFYKKKSWILESRYLTMEGRAMNRYMKDFEAE